jgi:quinol monooxygenase YgiN
MLVYPHSPSLRRSATLITEIATIVIDPARAVDFEAAVAAAAPHFKAAEGCHGMALDRCIEDPARYFLRVEWKSVDHHMVTFRESAGFQAWRILAGPFFAEPPVVVHSDRAVTGF